MYETADNTLRSDFPSEISDLFEFVYIAKDSVREEDGEVRPGIGGQIYKLLGMGDQPAKTGFIPDIVKQLACI